MAYLPPHPFSELPPDEYDDVPVDQNQEDKQENESEFADFEL